MVRKTRKEILDMYKYTNEIVDEVIYLPLSSVGKNGCVIRKNDIKSIIDNNNSTCTMTLDDDQKINFRYSAKILFDTIYKTEK